MDIERFSGRTLTVRPLDLLTANEFISTHHRQGSVKVATKVVALGLFHHDRLLGVAQFCYPRTAAMKRKYTVELLRLAFPKNVRVVGGASKLITHYRREYRPADIFTYQDMRGEATDVYSHCGFVLVSQAKKKEYLVAPGKTLDTASRKEALGLAYAIRYGPDRITGSKLGERYHEDGTRKTNKELFLEDLGWHLESTPGDRVWAWRNENLTFYTYRITASDSDKYYFGVSHVKKANARTKDCEEDGYWGSGGNSKSGKFKNWKARHRTKLQKEVLGVYQRKSEAYAAEARLIDDLWLSDPNCLNSRSGGAIKGFDASIKNISMKLCSVHGEAKHVGDSCFKCFTTAPLKKAICDLHGEVTHRGETCLHCVADESWRMRECEEHGLVLHISDTCAACRTARAFSTRECTRHGSTKHRGGQCVRCTLEETLQLGLCPVHGEVIHMGSKCATCTSRARFRVLPCEVHGEVTHMGLRCLTCNPVESYEIRVCAIHGEVKHRGDLCVTCANQRIVSKQDCPQHGLSTFQGSTCMRCSAASLISTESCEVHGPAKHRGGTCLKCLNAPQELHCGVHGRAPHRGQACMRCSSEKTAHTRWHGKTPKKDCRYCSSGETQDSS